MTPSESKQATLDQLGVLPVIADALDPDQVAAARLGQRRGADPFGFRIDWRTTINAMSTSEQVHAGTYTLDPVRRTYGQGFQAA